MADVLKQSNTQITDVTGAALIDGASSTTYTVLSITICEIGNGSGKNFNVWRADAGGSTNRRYLYYEQPIPGKATFVHNDKLVLEATQELWVSAPAGSSSLDVVVSYLEQT